MTFTILYKHREAAGRWPFQVQAANSTPITHKSIVVSNLKWVTESSPLLSETVISYHHFSNQTNMHLGLKGTPSPPTNPIRALFQNITEGIWFPISIYWWPVYMHCSCSNQRENCLQGNWLNTGLWNVCFWRHLKVSSTGPWASRPNSELSPVLSRRMDELTPEVSSSLNYSFIIWLSFFYQNCKGTDSFLMVACWCTIEKHTAVLQLIVKTYKLVNHVSFYFHYRTVPVSSMVNEILPLC